ncbi:MAG: GNAT family N-acetyltransferase [Firmicutes bacterium]|nr:GNAT family N-acetyltransferase [Bacillota bacterium]
MSLRYELNPGISAGEIASLRHQVGWESREKELAELVGCTYMTAACFEDDLLVGFVDVLSDGVEDALIRSLVVHPDYRRRGIALNLLKMVTERIKKSNIKTTNVLFEPELTDLYRKAGFRIVGGGLIDNEREGF